jgi:hypothetical protein
MNRSSSGLRRSIPASVALLAFIGCAEYPTRTATDEIATQVTDLPRLTDLTLLTGDPIGGWGGTGGGGSTVF